MRTSRIRLHRACAAALMAMVAAPTAEAATKHVSPGDNINDVEAVFKGLAPGDELIVAGGTYELSGLFDFNVQGTMNNPIVIRGEDGTQPHFHRAGTDQNIWDFDAEYTTIRGLRFSGGSAGLRVKSANRLTIEACEIDHTRDVAIRMNDSGITYESVRILHNEIHDTGVNGGGTSEGMYLGCNENACRLAHGLIQGNHVYAINRPEITQGDGIELKEGSYGTTISDNVIHDTNYPCILTYSAVGNGEPNIIERNLLYGCGDHGIQSAADAIIRNNIILSANVDGIAMQHHQNGDPANLTVVHNTILHTGGAGISVRNVVGSVVVANNAIYSESAAIHLGGNFPSLTLRGNVGTGSAPNGAMSAGVLTNDVAGGNFNGAPPVDVFPTSGGALRSAGDARDVPSNDFNGTPRNGEADVGAYAYQAGGNPGWPLAGTMKDTAASSSPDAGTGASDVGTSDAGALDGGRADGGQGSDARISGQDADPTNDGNEQMPSADSSMDCGGSCSCGATEPPRDHGFGGTIALTSLGIILALRRRHRASQKRGSL
ncbi:MAG: right-handed parallel beta-helix repeat-containing protein [Deltaproteobacteria bacterium]|nr:right-handed parallel beta-helix repeat-containing protein [Deltaproteobacteria bacterium]